MFAKRLLGLRASQGLPCKGRWHCKGKPRHRVGYSTLIRPECRNANMRCSENSQQPLHDTGVLAARGDQLQETPHGWSKDIADDPTVFKWLQHHNSRLDAAWGKCEVWLEEPMCAAPCAERHADATGVNASIPLPEPPWHPQGSTCPGEIQQQAADIWGCKKKIHNWSTFP